MMDGRGVVVEEEPEEVQVLLCGRRCCR
jgi:hypothetical protein